MGFFKNVIAKRCTGDEDQECLNFKDNKDLPDYLTSCDCGSSVKPVEKINQVPVLIVVGASLLVAVISVYKFRSMIFTLELIPDPKPTVTPSLSPVVDPKLVEAEKILAKLPKDKLLKFSMKTTNGNRDVLGWVDTSQTTPIVALKAATLEEWLKQHKPQSGTSEVISLVIENPNKPSKSALLPNVQKDEFFNAVLDAVLNSQLVNSSIDISRQEIDLHSGF